MKLICDTNVLVRAIVADDVQQAKIAQATINKADLIAVPTSALCEFVWVLDRRYGISGADIAAAVRKLIAGSKVEANRLSIAAGLAALDAGGDFADGVIAFEGASLGGETFASFDKDAVKLLKKQGQSTLLLS